MDPDNVAAAAVQALLPGMISADYHRSAYRVGYLSKRPVLFVANIYCPTPLVI